MTREEMGNNEIVGCDEGFERGEETGVCVCVCDT
jgi:hypothetical protein